MAQVNPPPQIKLPKEFAKSKDIRAYFKSLDRFWLQLWTRSGGGTDLLGDDSENIASVTGLINRLNSLTSEAEKKLEDIEQLTVSLNNGFSRLDELNNRIADVEQSVSNLDNLSGKVNNKVAGESSSTNNSVARFNGSSGDKIKDSEVIIDDNGKMSLSSIAADNILGGDLVANGTTERLFINEAADADTVMEIVADNTTNSVQFRINGSASNFFEIDDSGAELVGFGLIQKAPAFESLLGIFNSATALGVYQINGTTVINTNSLGSGITGSSLTSVGTLTNVNTSGDYSVDGTQVVTNQQSAVIDATDAATVILRLNDLLSRMRTHGLIAT